MKKLSKPRIAFVYDRINKYGGAERILESLHNLYPEAPFYTAVYNPQTAKWANGYDVRPSILQAIPFFRTNHEFLALFTPFAFERFDFSDFDIVMSITSSDAKCIITTPDTFHVSYCLTPTRYLWSGYQDYLNRPGLGLWGKVSSMILKQLSPMMRRWDLIGSSRPDQYIAISELVKGRIEKYYQRQVEQVIYPPVDTIKFSPCKFQKKCQFLPQNKLEHKKYFLTVSRMVGYKRTDLIIEAFNQLGWPLIVIGSGRNDIILKSQARENIKFIENYLTDEELVHYYSHCQGFVYSGVEDFGLVAVEAQACGAPVIAYRDSGIAEIVKNGQTGILYHEQTVEALIYALEEFLKMQIDEKKCVINARRFSLDIFKNRMQEYMQHVNLLQY